MTISPNGVASLAGRLTALEDRETYANLITYVHSLPPGDEFRQMVQFFGLLTLVGQQIPDAAAELLAEIRAESMAAADHHRKVDERLGSLPSEIAAGVDVKEIAESMSEAFRQQLTATGLRDTAELLRTSSKEMSALSGEVSATLKPVTRDYQNVSATVSAELIKLTEASRELHNHNNQTRLVLSQLIERDQSSGWFVQAIMLLVLFLLGAICGGVFEKRQTEDVLNGMVTQIQRIQKPILLPAVAPRGAIARKH